VAVQSVCLPKLALEYAVTLVTALFLAAVVNVVLIVEDSWASVFCTAGVEAVSSIT
jgi:hypothetical protein